MQSEQLETSGRTILEQLGRNVSSWAAAAKQRGRNQAAASNQLGSNFLATELLGRTFAAIRQQIQQLRNS